MKSVWSDETGRRIKQVDKIRCCVLLTSCHFQNYLIKAAQEARVVIIIMNCMSGETDCSWVWHGAKHTKNNQKAAAAQGECPSHKHRVLLANSYVSPCYCSSNSRNESQALITRGLLPRPVARESSLSYCKKELDLCSRGCQPELLVVLQLNAATGFVFHRNLSLSTLSCRSDHSCTLHTSYLGRRCFKSLQFCWETILWLIFSWAPGRSPQRSTIAKQIW